MSELPTVSFVKRAVLQSDDGGNTYNVEVENAEKDTSGGSSTSGISSKVSLYDQLAKTISDRRNLRADGRPEELTIEDQEFVNRLMKQREMEAAKYEEEAKEYKRQRLLTSSNQGNITTTTLNEDLLSSSTTGNASSSQKKSKEEDDVVIIVKKKKKKKDVITPNE